MKYLILTLAVICYVRCAQATAAEDENAVRPTFRQSRTLDGGLTSGFTTALSSIGTIGVLGLVILGVLLLPTVLSILFAGAVKRSGVAAFRAFNDGFHVDKPAVMARLAMLQEAWQKFDVKDPQCRKRLICEVHSVESDLGPTARTLIKTMDYISNAGRFNLPEPMNGVIREYVESMRAGKELKDCSKYASCPYSIASQLRAN